MNIKVGQIRKWNYPDNSYIKIANIYNDGIVDIIEYYASGLSNYYRLATSYVVNSTYIMVNLEEELDKL